MRIELQGTIELLSRGLDADGGDVVVAQIMAVGAAVPNKSLEVHSAKVPMLRLELKPPVGNELKLGTKLKIYIMNEEE